jgi:hypothetical protein
VAIETLRPTIFSKLFTLRTHKRRKIKSGTKSDRPGIKTKERIDKEDTLLALFYS